MSEASEKRADKVLKNSSDLPSFDSVRRYKDKRVFLIYKKSNTETVYIIHDGDIFESFNYHKELTQDAKKDNAKRKVVINKVEASIIEDFISRYDKEKKSFNSNKKSIMSTVRSGFRDGDDKGDDKALGLNEEDSVYDGAFTGIIKNAMALGVSDVHIEVRKNKTKVRFRQHGKLQNVREWSYDYGNKMCSVIFSVLAQELQGVMFNPTAPQFARVSRTLNGDDIGLRVNSIPAFPDGYDVVIRILKMSTSAGDEDTLKISDLGYDKAQLDQIRYAMEQRSGGIMIAGTTGSGKSTTLQCGLKEKISSEPYLKVITIEDPPEYFIEGATQVPVKRKGNGGEEFLDAVKACMRCDPDIIMIGETRDDDTAQLLQAAVLTGHKTLSTIHAKDAIAVIARLEKMTVERMTMATKGFISLFMFQSLAPTSCPKCKIPLLSDAGKKVIRNKHKDRAELVMEKWFEVFKDISKYSTVDFDPENIYVVNESGCDNCSHGVVGASVVAEVLTPTLPVLKCIADGDDFAAQRAWVNGGGRPINLHAADKVMQGTVCPINAELAVGPLLECLESLPDEYNKN